MLITFVIVIIHQGCEDVTLSVDCTECYYPEPDSFNLIIHFSFEDGIDKVPFVLYRGEADKGNVDWIDTAYTSYIDDIIVATDMSYSVEAKYEFEDRTIIAIDETRVRTTLVSDVCSEDCFVIKGNELDVRLK